MKKYSLTVNENQIKILSNALDFYARIGIGQYEEIADFSFDRLNHDGKSHWDNLKYMLRESMRHMLNALKKLRHGLEPNQSFGISSNEVQPHFKVAYDLVQVIKNKLWEDSDTERYSTYSTITKIGKEPLATMTIKVERDEPLVDHMTRL